MPKLLWNTPYEDEIYPMDTSKKNEKLLSLVKSSVKVMDSCIFEDIDAISLKDDLYGNNIIEPIQKEESFNFTHLFMNT